MTEPENAALVRRYIEEALNGHDLAILDELLASDFVAHSPAGSRDRAGQKRMRAANWKASPDWRIDIRDVLTDGDRVAVRATAGGTHLGEQATPWGTVAPTARRITTSWIAIFRVAGGCIAESWVEGDSLGMFEQLGVIPPRSR